MTTGTPDCGSGDESQYYIGAGTTTIGVDMDVQVDVAQKTVQITLIGPADVWFGVGLNAQSMADVPYSIIVSGDSVMEVSLANHAAGTNLTQTVKVTSNTVDTTTKKRTVVMTRAMTGASAQYYSFDPVK